MTINTTMAEPCDKCGKLDANTCAECNPVPEMKTCPNCNGISTTGGATYTYCSMCNKTGKIGVELPAKDMSLAVALDFADNPRPYHTLQAPADTNGELYRALKVLAAAYRDAAPKTGDPALKAIMERDAWRNAMIGLCNGNEWHTTPDAAAAHLRGRLHPDRTVAYRDIWDRVSAVVEEAGAGKTELVEWLAGLVVAQKY